MVHDIRPQIKQLTAAFPNTQVKEETVAVYLRLLQDLPPADLQTVVDQCIAECKFFPTIAEIRERHLAITRNLAELSSAEAWGLVLSEIRRIGSWGVPHFDDPLTEKVVDMFGWLQLCQSENQMADRAQFMRMYQEVAGRERRIEALLPQSRRMLEQRTGMKSVGELALRSIKALDAIPALSAPNGTADDDCPF